MHVYLLGCLGLSPNAWGCTSKRTSPGPTTLHHSPRRRNSVYTFSTSWKEQVSLHPSSPLSPIESVLTSCITVWYGNCSAADHKTLQRTVNTAAKISGTPLPSILDIFLTRCSSKATSIVKDSTHPSHSLFQLLPLGRRFRSIRARSTRLLNSFCPQAVRALNWNPPAPLWNPLQTPTSWNMDHPPPPSPYHITEKLWKCFVQFEVCYTQVSGPVQTTCSNILSCMRTRHFSHITMCT